jgi:hypothetical protein
MGGVNVFGAWPPTLGRARRWKVVVIAGATALVSLGFGAARAPAPPPPIPVEGEIEVGRPCVVFGHKIGFGGIGFAPNSTVRVFAAALHYTLPGALPSMTVTSNAEGEISGDLTAPDRSANKWTWEQEEIVASGLNRGGEHRGEAVALMVLGSRFICSTLDHRRT